MMYQSAARTTVFAFLALAALGSHCVYGQEPTTGEKTRASRNQQSYNAPAATYTGQPKHLLKTVKTRVVVTNVDVKTRTIDVAPARSGQTFRVALLGSQPVDWSRLEALKVKFAQPHGMEQIKATKKAAKQTGKKSLLLEEITVGSKARMDYYPLHADDARGKVATRELIVEDLGPPR